MPCLLAGLTIAEYFRDVEGQDVLLFVDNIFRFTQVRELSSGLSLHMHAIIVPQQVSKLAACFALMAHRLTRLLQANSEVSALLGRIPSAVGYQPTLATDLGGLQERITTTTKGSITSVQVGVMGRRCRVNIEQPVLQSHMSN